MNDTAKRRAQKPKTQKSKPQEREPLAEPAESGSGAVGLKPSHACPICWPRFHGVGRLIQASVSTASLLCTACSHSWSLPIGEFNEAVENYLPPTTE